MGVIIGVIRVFYLLCCLPVSYSNVELECNGALGMENRMIAEDQLSAESDPGNSDRARLHGDRAWRGRDRDAPRWIQVRFVNLMNITAVATQGNPHGNEVEWVTKYRVDYSVDGLTWDNVDNSHIFTANLDRNTVVRNNITNPVLVRYIRIYPTMKHDGDRYGLRFELYGCEVPVCDVLDAPMNGHVINTSTTVFMIGDMQMIECDDGFTAMGGTSTVCTATGDAASWEADISSTTCVPVCDVLDAPMNGRVTNPLTTVFMIDDMLMIECDNGFAAMGGTSTVCTATGDAASWELDISSTTCVPVCGVLNAPMYGHVTNTSTTVFMIDDMLMIECDNGFTAMGGTSTVCTATGDAARWEPDISSTTCANTTTSATISPNITAKSRGAVAGPVIGVLLIIVIIIIVVIWLRKSKRETAKSTPQSGQAFDGPYELTIEGNNGPAKTQPTVVGQPNQEEYAYVDVNKANTPQNEVKSDTGDIYQDVQDKPDEYAYAYADVNESKTSDEPSDDGLVHIYAKSKHGGRPITKGKQNPAADTGDIYQTIQEPPNENEYAYADVKVDANGKPANPKEGWEDNVIYAAGDDDEGIAADKGKEGWVDNNIYATTDNDAQNAEGKSQVEGWEDNIIYGDK